MIFGGRLGMYKYFDMDDTIKEAMDISKKYTPGRRNIFGTEVLATDFDQIYEFAYRASWGQRGRNRGLPQLGKLRLIIILI